MKELNWDDLKLFLYVAEGGGLSAAARDTGISAPTIGRRMLSLEHQSGHALFHRSQTGYKLTPTGQALLKRARAMRAAAQPVQAFLSAQTETPFLRVSAGTGTAAFLADNHALLNRPGDGFRLHFITTENRLDIAHRDADLGIRNRPAEGGNLASRKLALLRFAPYRNRSVANPELMDWLALDPAHARHPASNWVLQQNHRIAAMANTVSTLHQLIRSGAGIGIMPCLVGDSDPSLTRAGPVIEDLTETQYLVMHNDDRHRTPLRRLIDRIVGLYHDNARLLAGESSLNVQPQDH